jgi:hypothetical protein
MTKTPSTQRRLLMALLGAVCTTSALPQAGLWIHRRACLRRCSAANWASP